MKTDDAIDAGFNQWPLFDEMFERYLSDPASIDQSWHRLFDQLGGKYAKIASSPETELLKEAEVFVEPRPVKEREDFIRKFPVISADTPGDIRVYHLIEAYRRHGHLLADVNPIPTSKLPQTQELRLEELGFQEKELDLEFPTCGLTDSPTASLRIILQTLQTIYCGSIGVEYMGLDGHEMELWLQNKIEPTRCKPQLSIEQKQMILQHLNKSELFESFLHTKYVGQKRFSLEGAETLIPILAFVIEVGADLGMDNFIIGMAHRGRLNVLSNILDKSYSDIFAEFEESYIPDSFEGSGDVKYHKGFYSELLTTNGHRVQIRLTPNPSHLESVDAVVEGQTKALQITSEDGEERVAPILIHGDAAISGQGVVYETMQLSNLEGYRTGGTIHVVINNQIGFTTLPEDCRSTRYCTDIAKAFGAPVFHVNAEDPEACIYATVLATELRQKFKRDVFIDLVCYRKYGHNESDEPAFTQPLEYQIIRKKNPIREIYRDFLIHQGVVERYVAEKLEVEFKKALNEALRGSKLKMEDGKQKGPDLLKSTSSDELFKPVKTGVPVGELYKIAKLSFTAPDGLIIHKKLENLLKERQEMAKGEKPLDWGMAEIMAYASLLFEGFDVRLSGQDSCRGTFSHRHLLWMAQKTGQKYFPLRHLKKGQGRFDIYNSPLSEYAVLGFEFGYSMANPEALVLWEAQFGDFCNSAQVVIDQYISTSEQKWGVKSSVVLLLPHGYEGQGPEHSSARMERFLLLAGNENIRICNPTTPAQFFHLLRRQLLNNIYKPLIVFTPKSLLRHSLCISAIEELEKGRFEEILEDPAPSKKPTRLAFCSGRIYYDILIEREKVKSKNLVLIRIEQLYPLHLEKIKKVIDQYQGVKEYLWIQEEPKNMGAWNFIHPLIEKLLPTGKRLRYIGRGGSASPAVGSFALHRKQHAAMLNEIFPIEEEPELDITHFHRV